MKKRSIGLFGLIIFVCGLIFVQGCSQSAHPKFQSEYQAILLTTGQVFFGKVEFLGEEYVQVKNVFYIRSLVNQQTKEVSNTLIKKGNELHGADRMFINTRHIIMMEPVSPESQLGKKIKEQESQKPTEQK